MMSDSVLLSVVAIEKCLPSHVIVCFSDIQRIQSLSRRYFEACLKEVKFLNGTERGVLVDQR